MPRRIVVIGAGIGGLSATIDLASSGSDVILLEQAGVPGGKMRELAVGDARIDSGPTVFTMRWVFDELYSKAGRQLEHELELHAAPVLARHWWPDGSQLDLFPGVDDSAAAIAAFAGEADADGYRRFAEASEAMYDTLRDTFMRRDKPGPVGLSLSLGVSGLPRLYATRPFATLWDDLGRYFRDARLRQLFARYATYCGSSPFSAPATLALIAHVERAGVFYVAGGMQRLAESLCAVAADCGASVRLGCGAAEILTDGARVSGVVTDDGDVLTADAVLFNGDVQALGRGLLGDALKTAVPSRHGEPRSLSALTYSLSADVGDFPLDHHSVFFGDDYPAEFRALFERGEIHTRPTVYVCAQDRSGNGHVSGKERLFVLTNAPARDLSAAEIEAGEEATRAALSSAGLDLPLSAATAVRFTPNDFASRFPGTDGAIYGWPTHGMMGSFRRQGARAKLRGLYLAGGSVHPGPGVPMTALSGRIAADAIRKDAGN